MPREILVDWTTDSGTGKVSVFYFNEATSVASQRSALNTFLSGVDGSCANSISWSIRTAGVERNSTTGILESAWVDSTVYSGTGASATEPVPDASQALFRWQTDHVVNGRFLTGRTYIPGWSVANVTNGNITEANRAGVEAIGQALITAGVQLGVWHRPVLAAGGQFWSADVCDVWAEFAVLRRRR